MTKLTATEFKELSPTAAYSAYDDAFAGQAAARLSQSDAITSHEQSEADKAKAIADNTVAIEKLNDDHAAALAAKDAEKTQAVTAATAPLQAQIDTLTATVADRDALAKRVDTLTAANAMLAAQIAGSKGSRVIHLSAVDETVLALGAAATGVSVDELLAGKVAAWLNEGAVANQADVFKVAMWKFAGADPKVQGQVLSLLGLLDYAALPPESRDKALNAFALDAFRALDAATQGQVFGLLGLT